MFNFQKRRSDEPTKQWLKRLAVDRLTQVVVGLALLAFSSGAYQVATGGHEDVGAEVSIGEPQFVATPKPKPRLIERLVAVGGEFTRREPRAQMSLAPSTPVSTIEARRKRNNTVRLGKIYGPMRPKVAAVIADLEGKGWRPFIDEGVYRTPAEQLAKYRRGVSKVTWSFHNATNRNGTPGSLAADVVDVKWGWSSKTPRRYWLQLAASARAHGIETGAAFGLSKRPTDKAALLKAINERMFDARVPIGWDPSHLQPRGLDMKAASRGARPRF